MGEHAVTEEDLKKIEAKAEEFCKQKHPFQRLVVSKEQALDLFRDNPFKVIIIFAILFIQYHISFFNS